ncbi:hypothetical protein VNO77_43965 [Canavalia gladiata]|uniref:Uncharacterized protein n=1 Tax=Canavalia gladiata TaxID=3824 RepID=A0AAN9PPX5_CANGL
MSGHMVELHRGSLSHVDAWFLYSPHQEIGFPFFLARKLYQLEPLHASDGGTGRSSKRPKLTLLDHYEGREQVHSVKLLRIGFHSFHKAIRSWMCVKRGLHASPKLPLAIALCNHDHRAHGRLLNACYVYFKLDSAFRTTLAHIAPLACLFLNPNDACLSFGSAMESLARERVEVPWSAIPPRFFVFP